MHKHSFGDCEGTLRATAGVLSYLSRNKADAFELPVSEIEGFDIDPERHLLRVRRRGGRTWNFSAIGDEAAPFAALQREVRKARR